MLDTPTDAGRSDLVAGPGGDDQTQQYLRFALGADMHAVRIDLVREILEAGHMTPLPLMPDFVRGVMNLRGAVVPVIDLGARLHLGATVVGRRTCVVLVDVAVADADGQGKPYTMGVLVDAVYEVFSTRTADSEPVPRLGTRIPPQFIRSMVRVRDRATPELDLQAILDQTALAELIARHGSTH